MPKYLALLPIALLLATPLAAADEDEITAVARKTSDTWLTVNGPDNDGLVSVRIDISDLNLVSELDQSTMYGRVRAGANELCERIAPVSLPVYLETRCRADTFRNAKPQMASAIEAMKRGERVAAIGTQPRLAR